MSDPITIALHTARKQRDDGGALTTETTTRGVPLFSGPIHSSVRGRTDHLPLTVASGSYVLPADVVSAGGQGSTMGGFKVLRRTFGGEPYDQRAGPYGQNKGVYGLPVTYAKGGKVRAAGILFLSPEKEVLLMRRAKPDDDHGGEWALPAGGIEKGETPEQAARRETREEAGYDHEGGLSPFMHSDSHGADFVTYLAHSDRFEPKLNDEHDRAKWVTLDEAAKLPLHPGVKAALAKLAKRAGKAHGGESSGVPIVAAGGEHVLTPEQVRRVGGGDIDMGHRVLDSFVRRVRRELIETLSKLPGPRRD
jgi:8-oxo-dGTP pyrophosphatase MutT (NUDIX family)